MWKRLIVLLLVVSFGLMASYVYAGGCEKGKSDKHNMEDKVFHKAMMLIKNQEELGLTDEQIKKVKDLKIATKKDVIKKKADIEILGLDIKAALWDDVVDLNALNALIDTKYELKKEKTKSLVAAYVELKGVLTEEQKTKLKDLCKKDKK
ncbi:MAG: Spy/CpxP family protein refolding chaperone [Candidatus Omnitrophica bacterium]|nr:Spy/CpxP family protein refolding chaperone [Candidatus Omnitrophota bacterium]MBU4590393.1 Spy/CpxP family protein refolding chaperone [Candidatus Omnitrophota bacterium]